MNEADLVARLLDGWGANPMAFLGVDISKGDFHAHLSQNGESRKEVFSNTTGGYRQLRSWLKQQKPINVHVCMEATGAYWIGLASDLHAHGVRVSVVNPARIKAFAKSQLRRTKTDSVDAQIIADLCRTQTPTLWEPPARETLELRALVAYQELLISEQTRAKQVARSVHEAHLLDSLSAQHQQALKSLLKDIGAQIRDLIARTPDMNEDAALLETIPGIAWKTAASIIARLPMDQLRNSKAAAAYAGLCPSDRQSGTSIHGKARLSKTGNADLRRTLYMPALTALRGRSSLTQFGARLTHAGKPPKVVIAATMRKLLTIAYAVLKSRRPYAEATSP